MIEEVNGYWKTGNLEYPFGRGINFQIEVNDVDIIKENLIANKIELFRDITVSNYECNGQLILQKEFLVQDIEGYLLRICSEE